MPEPYSAVPRFPSTFQSLLAAAIFLATILVFIQSCRKMDRVLSASPTVSETENNFFNNHRSADAREKALADFLKRRNDSSQFIQKAVERIGYPRWDKAMRVRLSSSLQLRTESENNDTAVTYIPFVRDGQNFVNAAMAVYTSAGDTSFSYILDWQYRQTLSPATTDHALKYFLFFANHDNRVFGHTRFRLKDNRILQSVSDTLVNTNKEYMLELAGTGESRLELMPAPDPELPHSSCLMVNDMITAGYVVNYHKIGKVCVIDSYYLPGSSGGGGGGAGSGGGDPPDDDPPPCGNTDPGLSGRVYDPCDTGWDPIPIDDPPPPCDSYITALGNDVNFANQFKSLADTSVINLNYEKGFIVNDRIGNNYQPIQGEPTKPFIRYVLTAPANGVLHTHCNPVTAMYRLAPMFSPEDVLDMAKNFLAGMAKDSNNFFIGLAHGYGPPYLLKVTNVAKFRKFAEKIVKMEASDDKKTKRFTEEYYEKFKFDVPEMNERGFLEMLNLEKAGNGLTLYRAADNDCRKWKKLERDGFNQTGVIETPCN